MRGVKEGKHTHSVKEGKVGPKKEEKEGEEKNRGIPSVNGSSSTVKMSTYPDRTTSAGPVEQASRCQMY